MKSKILFLLMSLSTFTWAQITVDSSSVVAPGQTRYIAFDYMPASTINVGMANANAQNWDFSDLVANELDTLYFVLPADADYPSSNPATTLSVNTTSDECLHFSVSNSGLYFVEFTDASGSFSLMETFANFPMQYGSNFSSSLSIDTIVENDFVPIPGIDLIRYKKDTTNTATVDAWGTATTPLGTFDVLRLKKDGSSIDSIWTKGAPVSHQVQTVGMTFNPDTLVINVLDTVFFTGLGYHDATEVDEATYLANGTISNGGFVYLTDDFHVFTEPGTYYYVCTPHASMGMKGMITVNNDWSLYQTSSIAGGEPTYDFWTNNANAAGLPLVTLYTDGNGAIDNADFLTTTPMVSDLQKEELLNTSIYPNPAQDYIIISVKEASNLQILSVDGKIVYESAFTEQERVSLKDFAEGMYLYQVQTKDATQSGTFNIVR